uniref:Uncharacterized protein n=1 Tax=Anopheles culicifacies TaxID=139723 RepID=A0A182MJM9_9DIPT
MVTTVDHTILAQLARFITYVLVNDSACVTNIIVPANTSIQQLLIVKTGLSAISFAKNDILYLLSIEEANLNHIPPTLGNLKNLSYIKINHTPLQQLDVSHFCHLPRLHVIDLCHNKIHLITGQQYPKCGPLLVEIWLANNRLKNLNLNVFVPFSNLEAFTVSNNMIETISGAFKNTQISEVSLSNNLISKLDLCEWSPMPYVTNLFMEHNKLTNVPKCLGRMPNLLVINLEHNQLQNVSIDELRELKQLELLRLSWNPIVSFAMHEHSLPPSLKELDIRHISLQFLNISPKVAQAVMIQTLFLVSIAVMHCSAFQFRCQQITKNYTCTITNYNPKLEGAFLFNHVPNQTDIIDFKNLIQATVGSMIFSNIPRSVGTISFSGSSTVRAMVVPRNISFTEIIATEPTMVRMRFERNCTLAKLFVMQSSMTAIPPTLINLPNLSFFKLSSSPIEQIYLDQFCNLSQLTALNFRYNLITTVTFRNGSATARCVTVLDKLLLSNNKIRSVNMTVFASMQELRIIDFEDNLIETVEGRFTNSKIASLILANNNLLTIDLCQWNTMPLINSFSLHKNSLQLLPKCLGRMPRVKFINFNHNKLTQITMDAFAMLKEIRSENCQNAIRPIVVGKEMVGETCASDLLGTRRKQRLYIILFKYYPLMIICFKPLPILGYKMVCKTAIKHHCFIDHLNPRMTKLSSLRANLPADVAFVQFRHLETSTIDHTIFNYLDHSVESVRIVDSRALLKLIVPANFTIKQLTVEKTHLAWIHFQANHAITGVWITWSYLYQIPPSLRNLKSLNYIQLKNSLVQHLNLDLLEWCSKLDSLDLTHNNIHTITTTLNDEQRRSLSLLNLSHNQLRIINLEVLSPLGWFKDVNLAHNKIELLVGRFASDYLSTLTLAHNRLKTLNFCQWKPMPSLQSISLASNELSHVPNCMNRLSGLSIICFSNNKLTSVSMDVFGEMHNLTDLDLTANRISLIKFREERYPKRLERLIFKSNKIECNNLGDLPFCPLDIEFEKSQNQSSWERTNVRFLKQLIVIT